MLRSGPIGVCVVFCHGAEASEAVGREEDLLGGLVADHDLRPVDHGGKNEGQGVGTQAQALAVLDHNAAVLGDGVGPEELLHIQERLGIAHHLHLRVERGKLGDVGTVVRLHVGDDEVIGGCAAQCLGQIFQPRVGGAGIHRIEDRGLFVPDDIGVVADARGHGVLALKQVDGGIIHADAQNGIADLFHAHRRQPFSDFIVFPANRKFLLGTFLSIAHGYPHCKARLYTTSQSRSRSTGVHPLSHTRHLPPAGGSPS